jgi:multicomponent Na+:H+ antiporter subunit G
VGKSETLGSILVLLGLAIFNGFEINSVKLLAILLFIALANPTATHIISRAAYRCGLPPWLLKHPQNGKNSSRANEDQMVENSIVQGKQR